MNESWPHQFVKDGSPIIIDEERVQQPLICVHCHKKYVNGKDSPPPNPCPARDHKKTMRRVTNG